MSTLLHPPPAPQPACAAEDAVKTSPKQPSVEVTSSRDNGYQSEDPSILMLPSYKMCTLSQVCRHHTQPCLTQLSPLQESRESYASMESPRCRASSLLLMAKQTKHGEGGHSTPNMELVTDSSCDYPYRPLLTPCSQEGPHFTESVRSLSTIPPIPIIAYPPGEEQGLQRIIRQRSNPEHKSQKCNHSPKLSPDSRRKSFIPGVGSERFASVVTDSLKLNGAAGQFKQVDIYASTSI